MGNRFLPYSTQHMQGFQHYFSLELRIKIASMFISYFCTLLR